MDRIHTQINWFKELDQKLRDKDEPKDGPKGEADQRDDEFMDASNIEVPGGDDFKDLLLDDEEVTAVEVEAKKEGGSKLEFQKRMAAGIHDAFRAKRARKSG